jgi:hypothetical protein
METKTDHTEELLAALKDAEKQIDGLKESSESPYDVEACDTALEIMRAAIAKAEGK